MLRNFAASVAVLAAAALIGMWAADRLAVENYFSWVLHGFAVVIFTGGAAVIVNWLLYPKTMEGLVSRFRARGKNRE